MISERELIRRIGSGGIFPHQQVVKGIGDDCAVFGLSAGDTGDLLGLATTDTLVQNVHFNLDWHPPELLGRKAAAVNISDIAAMGGRPFLALLSIAVPGDLHTSVIDRFMDGFLTELRQNRVMLAGGDTVKSGHELSFSVTVIGQVKRDKIVYRSGAGKGDQVWVSGFLGEAAAGLALCQQRQDLAGKWPGLVAAHLNPTPEVELGCLAAESGLVSSMLDMSDGLATDLAHICEESGAGALIRAEEVPLSKELREAAPLLGLDPLDLAVTGGEDYRLLLTCPPAAGMKLEALVKERLGRRLFCIGEIVEGSGVKMWFNSAEIDITFQGYDHFGT